MTEDIERPIEMRLEAEARRTVKGKNEYEKQTKK